MRWFQGGIAEAVATSKTKNAVFVVFVEGKDEASKNAASALDDVAVLSKLESEDFVAVKLDSGSEAYNQFVQIYQLVPVPSLFFIGGNGVPLEVVAGEVDVPELVQRIATVLEKSGKVVPADTQELTEEQKIERAKELIEKKQKLKQEEEEQTQKQKEVERRKVGQEVQKLRRWQQDQELKQLKEERQREKAEEAAARERVLKQIAEDRAQRASRYYAGLEGNKKQAEEKLKGQSEQQAQDTASKCVVARIQFRLPDGSSHSHNFETAATLGEVRLYAATHLNLPFREFVMSTTFPRREFTAADDGQTVTELQLVPTAVILILPATSGNAISSSQSYGSAVSRMLWSVLTPFFSILNYVRNLVFGGGGAVGGDGGARNSRRSSLHAASEQSPTGARRRVRTTETTTVHRQGNVHRLTNRQDASDDENNTWNGNSTQQM
ncbi:UBX domain-containing protein 4 [Zootermopsis nevadensis]|uniref:UBX domain-containing protein 4 n=1 Tax=Zootermopsis nevadensis TaxID=136037 RepID=A0A067RCC2_ZOONE|nr:UBX domain-containing protein 4 [Zootermopsis nevadensis]KDR21412.1 UBX domain-containing protein 4 [Zootermopsis nevadensis]